MEPSGKKTTLKKGSTVLRMPSQTPIHAGKGHLAQHKKGGGGNPTNKFACSLLSSSPKQQKKFDFRSFELIVAQQQ